MPRDAGSIPAASTTFLWTEPALEQGGHINSLCARRVSVHTMCMLLGRVYDLPHCFHCLCEPLGACSRRMVSVVLEAERRFCHGVGI